MTTWWAINPKTKKYWHPDPCYASQKIAELSDGSLVVLTDKLKEGWSITPLHGHVKTTTPPSSTPDPVDMIECPNCRGHKSVMEMVGHDADYNSEWESRQCWHCNGTGTVPKTKK